MHAINVGISCNNNVVIAKTFIRFFDIQSMLQKIEFLIFIYYLFRKSEAVKRFSAQTKYSLRFNTACLRDGSAGTIPFCYEDGTFLLLFQNGILLFTGCLIIEVIAAIP